MNYTKQIRFVWDATKSDSCFKDRGFDFAYAASVFTDPFKLVETDNRFSYGEDRYKLIGSIEGRLYVVIYTVRERAIRIISARKANRREVKHYENRPYDD